ncbi:MAG: hypothetical protein JWR84_2433 [Caulobacter sp.]|nr:hypothetical protein [Caulobacter sp.]
MTAEVGERIEVLVPDPFAPARIEAIKAAPAFQTAMRRSFRGALSCYEADPLTSNTLKDAGRDYTGWLCCYLHLTDGGLTLARLRELCGRSSFISANAAEAVLGQMRDRDLVVVAPEQPNRREIRLLVTPPLLHNYRERFRVEIESAALLDDRMARLAASWDRPGVFETYFTAYVGGVVMGASAYDPAQPGMWSLFSHHAGPLILMRICDGADEDDVFPPARPAPLSLSAIAQAFGVSRTHVARVIAESEAEGLMTRSPGGRSITLEPAMRDRISFFFAVVYILATMVFVWVEDQLDLVDASTGANYRFLR